MNNYSPHYNATYTKFFCCFLKLTECSASEVNIYNITFEFDLYQELRFFLLSTCADTCAVYYYFFTKPTTIRQLKTSTCIKSQYHSQNVYNYQDQDYKLVNVTAPNREFCNAKSLTTVNDHKFIS